jgi:hypothetical protein
MDTENVNPELLDSSITITLKASQWQVILDHLELGHALGKAFGHSGAVKPVQAELFAQARPQLDAAISAAVQAMTSTDSQHSRTN